MRFSTGRKSKLRFENVIMMVLYAQKENGRWRAKNSRRFISTRPPLSIAIEPQKVEASVSYDAKGGAAKFEYIFSERTEITGYMKLRLWIEARGSNERRISRPLSRSWDKAGERVPLPSCLNMTSVRLPSAGCARATASSIRLTPDQPIHTHQQELLLQPGEIVPYLECPNLALVDIVRSRRSTAGCSFRATTSRESPACAIRKCMRSTRNSGLHFTLQWPREITHFASARPDPSGRAVKCRNRRTSPPKPQSRLLPIGLGLPIRLLPTLGD